MSAGGSIYNALPSNLVAATAQPSMSALGSLSLSSGTGIFTNSGIMSALANINVATAVPQNILLNNSGTLQALAGAIQFRNSDFVEKFHTDIVGGNFISKEFNVFSGDGIIDIVANDLTGVLNLSGGEGYVTASSSIQMGSMVFTGDPAIVSGSDIFLVFDGTPPGAPMTVSAKGNIINVDCTTIGGTSVSYIAGGNIILDGINTITSGGDITLSAGGTLSIPGINISGGGDVGLWGSTINGPGVQISTSNKGQVTMVAESSILAPDLKISSDGRVVISAKNDIMAENAIVGALDIVSFEAINGNIIMPESIVSTSANPTKTDIAPDGYLPPGPSPFGILPQSVFYAAKHSITIGDTIAPAGAVVVRGGGDLKAGLWFWGQNEATVKTGYIDLSGRLPGHGLIYMDNYGGTIETGYLNGNGRRIFVEAFDGVTINGPILNKGVIARTTPFFVSDTFIN